MQRINKKILDFFSMLSDETRLNILITLTEGPRPVNEIYEAIGREKMTLSAISHQLRQMNDLGIVEYDKQGRERLFKLSENFCWCILRDAFNHFQEGKTCKACCKARAESKADKR